MILGNRTKLHQTPIGSRPFGLDKFVIRRPVDQLQTANIRTKTGIVKIGLHPGNIVGPDAVLIVGIAAAIGD